MEKKYRLDAPENRAFLKELREELLRFGRAFASEGGSSYYLGDDGAPLKDRPRETWITGRMAHVYSIGAMLSKKECEPLADAALLGLLGELRDKKNGGWYFGITKEGEPLPGKSCYAHAFVILAASSAYLAKRPHAKALLEDALAIYDRRFWDEEAGLAYDTWNTEFTVLDGYRGLNSNMHTVEAFLAAADALGDETYRARAGRIIDRVIGWAFDCDFRIPEHFTRDWEPDLTYGRENPDDPFKPYGATPGHGMEWARLIVQWAFSTYRKEEAKRLPYLDAAKRLYRRALKDAWQADGEPGFVYTTDWDGTPVICDRMHWTLAEAINTSAVLFRACQKERYADDYGMFLKYLDEKVLDHKNGSWFHQLDAKNRVIGTVWPGKPDLYHAFQAALIPYAPADLSVAKAVAMGI